MITLAVNGETRQVECAADEPLAYVLRNSLGLPGTRLGCGLEQCGSCLVLVDDAPAYACTLTAAACDGCAVTTIEGLAQDGLLHPVQQALLEHNAAQCGYCLSGIVMRATALFAADSHPSPQAIREALAPQICRCGAHPRVLRALDELAAGG